MDGKGRVCVGFRSVEMLKTSGMRVFCRVKGLAWLIGLLV